MQGEWQLLTGNPRIKVLVGEFGSGKTELAVNYAIQLSRQEYTTAVVDIDLVKPYFRTRENKKILEDNGVIVVAPEQKLFHSDLPVMPQNLTRVLYDPNCQVVMDVGGGDSAIVLGQINQQIIENSYEAFMVVNTKRPFTATANDIASALKRIEKVSRLKISGLVSNTNLGRETNTAHVMDGVDILRTAADKLNVPIQWVVVPEWLEGQVMIDYPIFYLHPYTQYPWMG